MLLFETIEIPIERYLKVKFHSSAQKNIEKSKEYSMGSRVNVNQDKYE